MLTVPVPTASVLPVTSAVNESPCINNDTLAKLVSPLNTGSATVGAVNPAEYRPYPFVILTSSI